MAIIKCKMCGGDLVLTEGATIAECEYCGTVQTVPAADNEKKLVLFERAERLRKACDFDKAATVYESIVADFRQEAEAYWGLVLCNYGIEYVDDPATGKKVPTCHRTSFDSIMDDINFEQALENADTVARKVYRDEAKAIEEIRKGINEVSSKEAPYDIFICYKETAETGERTLDSVMAQDIYDALTEKGYRVFFSRITLEDKLGQEYEPYIFAALNSAKVMLAIGTDYEYYNAVWVKNEWSRFLKMIALGQKKTLIPCYKNIDAYDMPKEFAKLQAQDLGKVGAMQDLMRGIEKLIPIGGKTVATPVSGGNLIEETLNKAFEMLNMQDWESAQRSLETVRGYAPDHTIALVGCLMVQRMCPQMDKLGMGTLPLDSSEFFQRAMRTADGTLKSQLIEYNNSTIYNYAMMQAQKNQIQTVQDAIVQMQRLGNYRDAVQQAAAMQMQLKKLQGKRRAKKIVLAVSIVTVIAIIGVVALILVNNAKKEAYNEGLTYMESWEYEKAAASFEKAGGYEDAQAMCEDASTKAQIVQEKINDLLEGTNTWTQYSVDSPNLNMYNGYLNVTVDGWNYILYGNDTQLSVELEGELLYDVETDTYMFKTGEGDICTAKLNNGVLSMIGTTEPAGHTFFSPKAQKELTYTEGVELMNQGMYSAAMECFQMISGYNDADELWEVCMTNSESEYLKAEEFFDKLEEQGGGYADWELFEEVVMPELEAGNFYVAVEFLNNGTILNAECIMVICEYVLKGAAEGTADLFQIRSECEAINYGMIYMFGM